MTLDHVESISIDDVEALFELFSDAGPFVTPRTLSDYWLYARLFSNTCLCVRDGSNLAGAVIAFRNQLPGTDDIYVQDVAVDPAHRRNGIAERLIGELIERSHGLSVRRIWLTSEHENSAAIRVWERLGFTNRPSDYLSDGLWLTRNLKGRGRDRAVFEWNG